MRGACIRRSCRLERHGLLRAKAPATARLQQLAQLLEIKTGDFVGGHGFLKQLTRRFEKHRREQGLIFREHAVENGENLALEVPDLFREPETKAAQFAQL